ncbi:mitochondrion organization and biogenesis protein [Aspergillus nomiae NRRL 13137]|uniref:Required for respiratory growth protein 9, mitochondrial n=1 Tax=Aspergillus nomiae NRRL (strain ATCC 15546 / NRRL 13137 / CBS 260.88 / M93) TaxID=1509407 RepID=A0A0L1J9K2_ASPN3|nr:mitochondrion organization and biogenesis protein [Aspergillus nomiae NRRL 13137]KNG88446.1 mitochondrion organization and biogenesis protein [Aspergillus nomiae NRRL 13137]
MVAFCASSARLALPTLLRNVYRSEFTSELHSSRLISLRRASHSHQLCNNGRSFASVSRLLASQPGPHANSQQPSQPAITESSSEQLDATVYGSVSETPAKDTTIHRDRRDPNKPARKAKKTKFSSSQAEPDANSVKSSRDKKHVRSDRTSPDYKPKKKEHWQIQKDALKKKFKEGWNPSKKLSPDALEGIRHLHAVAPDKFTTPVLAEQFQVSPEAIRRILKSKWRPSETEMEDRRKRWEKRHDRIWSHLSELGLRPKTKRTEALDDSNILYGKGEEGNKPSE